MIQVLASGKGEGKTKRLIEMANIAVKQANGRVVFIDDDSRHIYDLHYDIRFIETTDFPIRNNSEFIGFISGVLSQDRDIEKIYIDGLYNIVRKITTDELIYLFEKLEKISNMHTVDFIITMNCNANDLPDSLRQFMVA